MLEQQKVMKNENSLKERRRRAHNSVRFRKVMNCLCSGEQLQVDEMIPSSESLATKDYSASVYSSQAGERKPDTGNIEEAESSLRESGSLNYEVPFLSLPIPTVLLLVFLMGVIDVFSAFSLL